MGWSLGLSLTPVVAWAVGCGWIPVWSSRPSYMLPYCLPSGQFPKICNISLIIFNAIKVITFFSKFIFHEFVLPKHDSSSLCNRMSTFRKNTMSSLSRMCSSFETLGADYTVILCHILEEGSPQPHHCNGLKATRFAITELIEKNPCL